MNPIYRIKGLEHYYSGRKVLQITDLEIRQGEILGILGPNGSGKSTLLRVLSFLEEPTVGAITFRGRDVREMESLRKDVSLLLQNSFLLKRSVFDNVAYGLRLRDVPAGEIAGRVEEALEWVGLDPDAFKKRQWFELSGGESQRIALASRLAIRPSVLMLDEPTASVDLKSELLIKKAVMLAAREWGTTLILVSHDYPWLQSICDRTVSMNLGEVIEEGHVNTFSGPWEACEEEGLVSAHLADGQTVYALCYGKQADTAVLSPSNVALAMERPNRLSTRNCLKGEVERMFYDRISQGIMVTVNVSSLTLSARLTRGSVQCMGLEPGKEVWVLFKASSVRWV
ncbi:MAG: ATP-binding cassette domain-containing protein [Synergistales bacterium]|nr:ATP-binding cassette domain-containing protein [Synergistales bacterium]